MSIPTTTWDWTQYTKEKQGDNPSYLQNYRNGKEYEIYATIRSNRISGNGISHNDLALKVNLDRKTLRRYTKRLVEKGLVTRGNGLQGKYLPTEEPFKDPLLHAYLFGHEFDFFLLKKEEDLVLTNKRPMIPNNQDFTTYRRFYEPKFTKIDKVERALFEVSNRIGAFITFVLIQAMNIEESDEVSEQWVKTAISQILLSLLSYFKDTVYRAIYRYPRGPTSRIEYYEQNPRFQLDKDIIEQLLNAFNDIYPLLGFELGDIIKELPKMSDLFKQDINHIDKRSQQQQNCAHKWKKETELGKNKYIKQCSKCDKIKSVKKNDLMSRNDHKT